NCGGSTALIRVRWPEGLGEERLKLFQVLFALPVGKGELEMVAVGSFDAGGDIDADVKAELASRRDAIFRRNGKGEHELVEERNLRKSQINPRMSGEPRGSRARPIPAGTTGGGHARFPSLQNGRSCESGQKCLV